MSLQPLRRDPASRKESCRSVLVEQLIESTYFFPMSSPSSPGTFRRKGLSFNDKLLSKLKSPAVHETALTVDVDQKISTCEGSDVEVVAGADSGFQVVDLGLPEMDSQVCVCGLGVQVRPCVMFLSTRVAIDRQLAMYVRVVVGRVVCVVGPMSVRWLI